MYNHNKAQQSKNRVHISWDILYLTWKCVFHSPFSIKHRGYKHSLSFFGHTKQFLFIAHFVILTCVYLEKCIILRFLWRRWWKCKSWHGWVINYCYLTLMMLLFHVIISMPDSQMFVKKDRRGLHRQPRALWYMILTHSIANIVGSSKNVHVY